MIRMKRPRIGQDQEIEIGPPLLKPAPKFVKHPARIEMIENEIAKFENPDHERLSSWLYPSFARCFSSAVSSRSAADSAGDMGTPLGASVVVRHRRPGRTGRKDSWRELAKIGMNSDH
jgi:hypothetical protein